MAEAAVSTPQLNLWYRVRAFLNAKLIHIFAGGLFTLLAIFLIYPIVFVLLKSLWGEEGFTLEFYKEFFRYNFLLLVAAQYADFGVQCHGHPAGGRFLLCLPDHPRPILDS